MATLDNYIIAPTLKAPSPTTCFYLECFNEDMGRYYRFYSLIAGHIPVNKKLAYKLHLGKSAMFQIEAKAESIEFDVARNSLTINLKRDEVLDMHIEMYGIGDFIKELDSHGWKQVKPVDLFKGLYDS